jgi:hypothetical protein
MPEWITSIIKFLKLPPSYMTAIWLMCSWIIFSSPTQLRKLGIIALQEEYRTWFGLGFIASSCVLAVFIITGINKALDDRYVRWQIKMRVSALTEEEKYIISIYITNKTRTERLDSLSGDVIQLEKSGIIKRCRNSVPIDAIDSKMGSIPYNLEDTAWYYIMSNKQLISSILTER